MIHLNTGNHAFSDATLCLRRPESWNQNDFKVFPFFCLTKLFLTCVILGLCTCCNKYVTPVHGLKFTACLYVICR